MAIRLVNTHTSLNQAINWKVEIHDLDYTGTPLEFKLRGNGFRLGYEGEEIPFNPIIPSKLILPIIIEDSSFDSFVQDIIGANEDRFFIVIKRGEVLDWTGRILIEQFVRENKPYPFVFTVTAIDGINLLKDIDYNNNGIPYFRYVSLKEHLQLALDKIGLNHLYAATDAFLTTTVTWKETNQVLAPTEDALIRTKVNASVFYTKNNKGEYNYKSCYEVVREICQLFGARIFMANGGFRLVQVNQYSDISFKEIRYRANGDYKDKIDLINRTKVLNDIDHIKLGGGVFRYLPALNSVTNEYTHRGANNYIAGVSWSNTVDSVYEIAELTVQPNEDKLLVKFTLEWESIDINNLEKSYYHKWRLQIKIGNYYLKRIATVSVYNVNYEQAEWTTTNSYYEIATKYINPSNFQNSGTIDVSFKTPFIREEGAATIQLEKVGTFDTSNSQVVMNLFYDAYNPSVEFLNDGKTSEREDSRLYKLVNTDNVGNSTVLNLKSFMGDGATALSVGKLQVFTGSVHEDSGEWNTQNGSENELIQRLLLQEIIKGRKNPMVIFENEIQSNSYYPSYTVSYDGILWVFMSGSFDSNIDLWAGTWFALSLVSGGITYSPPKFIPPNNPIEVVENPTIVSNGTSDTNTIISILEGIKNATLSSNISKSVSQTLIPTLNGVIGLTPGQTGRIINPTTGQSEIFEVVGLTPTQEIQINHTFENDYPEGSYIIKDILTPEVPTSFNIHKVLNHSGSFIDVSFDLPTVSSEVDKQLTVIRRGFHAIYEADFTISNDGSGQRRRINFPNIPLKNEAVLIKLTP